ncbi:MULTISPECIES: UDP-2,3-diacylglucosamine diphosphatase [unclassified Iodidimonas]|jgi:UDP-2,3-diacylglucosamine pyrophosphatase LpxH|uniref:UDP-2,3-diacylglucosamine diphosphatase n=1 Tax=unclassified Iodidimonas TaxID=2626145 RepID=UPI0024831C7B|nr:MULTISPECIES: UDP-2,3-diacylglucosamine diphosphatase [unclassified Iodidimonas]
MSQSFKPGLTLPLMSLLTLPRSKTSPSSQSSPKVADPAHLAAQYSDQGQKAGKPKKPKKSEKRHYRSIFISDIHLGTRGCRADYLIDFLRHVDCEKLYLVGDIIDGWQLKKSWYWDDQHHAVLRKILKFAEKGTEVIYIPGNHDEALRDYIDLDFAGVKIMKEAMHQTADGRTFWVLHGDAFDAIVLYHKWLAHLGDHAYGLLLRLNTSFNHLRRLFGYSYWSLSAFLKYKTKHAVAFMSRFEETVAKQAAHRAVDGVICGHIHHAETRMIGDVLYCNDGDWVESCTALVEHGDGRLEILRWADEISARTGGRSLIPYFSKKSAKHEVAA